MSNDLVSLVVNELQIPGIGPDVDLSFISRYNLRDIWMYLAENVKSKERSQLIHKNLAILKFQQSWTGRLDKEETDTDVCSDKRTTYQRLLLKVHQQKKQVAQLEAAIPNHQKTLSYTSQQSRHFQLSCEDSDTKLYLLKQHAASVKREIKMLKQFRQRIQAELDKYSYHKRQGQGDEMSKNLSQLRQVHSMVSTMLTKMLEGEVNKSAVNQDLRKIKNRLSLLHSCMTSSELLSSLVHETTFSSRKVHELISEIDPVADARHLGFSVVADGLVDESIDPPLSVSVGQMMAERQLEHQNSFLLTQTLLSQTKTCRLKANAQKQDVLKLLELSPHPSLLREVLEQSVEEEKAHAALDYLRFINTQLEQQVETSSDQLANLKKKHVLINSFRSDVQNKQHQIRVLLKQNSGSRAKLDEKKAVLISTLTKLTGNSDPISTLSSSVLPTSLTGEVRQFQTIPVYSLSPHPHSTIYNLENVRGKSKPHIDCISQQLSRRPYQSADAWLLSILNMSTDIMCLYSRSTPLEDLTSAQSQVKEATALIEQSKVSTSQLLRDLMPIVDKATKQVKSGLEKVDNVDKIVDNWWNQPGRHIVLNN